MHNRNSFDYAVVRVVPRIEREEFVNVGVLLHCRAVRFLEARTWLDRSRLVALSPLIDLEAVELHLTSIHRICKGNAAAGALGQLSMTGRFHWLVSPRSTIIQTSSVHCGLCSDPQAALERLFTQMVPLPQSSDH